jgi:hypothetical protein
VLAGGRAVAFSSVAGVALYRLQRALGGGIRN